MPEGTTTVATVAADPYFVNPGNWDDATRTAREGLLGNLKLKGWDQKPAVEALHEAVKSYHEVEKHLGIPREQLVRMPKDAADTEGWKAFNAKIGVPEKADGYDFSKIKFSDGSDLDDSFVNTMRESVHARGIPAAKAQELVSDFVKFMEGAEQQEIATRQAAIAEGRAKLDASWGANKEANKFIATQAVTKLGLPEDFIQTIENTVGYEPTMQSLLKLGQMMGEDKFVASGDGVTKGLLTREQAQAKLDELKRDAGWSAKVSAGDFKANEEFNSLVKIISGIGG
jgi:hypothetical protein